MVSRYIWSKHRRKWLHIIKYRLGQVRQQLGFVAPLSPQEQAEIAQWLPASAIPLFQTMSSADQRHSLRVCQGLQSRGCTDQDMLAAALLHDVGKAQGRVPFWTRPTIVLGKKLAPKLLARLVVYPDLDVHRHSVGAQFIAPRNAVFKNMNGEEDRAVKQGAIHCAPTNWRTWWKRSLSYAWYHADIGADLAAAAGLSERAVLYIRTHHQPNGPAAELHQVDEVS